MIKSPPLDEDIYTQFAYAYKQLGVFPESGSVPQRKACVERLNQTCTAVSMTGISMLWRKLRNDMEPRNILMLQVHVGNILMITAQNPITVKVPNLSRPILKAFRDTLKMLDINELLREISGFFSENTAKIV